ncbi:MAG: FliI/YscN family ATPase [Clostridiales bacterium]|nr:FliI/YscN family ATPase [Clostridiales bacterium]
MYYRKLADIVKKTEFANRLGKIENVIGMTIEASGVKGGIGDLCIISDMGKFPVLAEIVGFKDDRVLLMPYDEIRGISVGNYVKNTKRKLGVPVGGFLLGRIINAIGEPIDEGAPFVKKPGHFSGSGYTNPLSRPPISERLDFGVKAIDGLLTIGKGQRIGIFSGSGVGKSTLMGMVARKAYADINVIALVGERGREVLEFIQRDLGEEGLKKSIVVVATSDQPAMMRARCPLTATLVAEHFREQGLDVLLMMDSLTRFAMAQREIGLAIGEPPIARGYTPSIYAELPKLLERSGNFSTGSITGIYTVLVEGDDTNEPISDTVRGILDGHIVLSRKLAHRRHFPAIDVSASISRLMISIVSDEHINTAAKIRSILSIYEQNEDLVAIGAYKAGSNPELDAAIGKIGSINSFLTQDIDEAFTYNDILQKMKHIAS